MAEQAASTQMTAPLAQRVAIRDLVLVAFEARRSLTNPPADTSAMIFNVRESTGYNYDAERETLFATVKFEVSVHAGTEQSHAVEPTIRTTSEYVVAYALRLDEGETVEGMNNQFVDFARVNATFNAWPYLREQISSTAAKMGLHQLMLPTRKPVDPKQEPPLTK